MKSVRQFDRFVDMALNMAISNFGDLNIKGQTEVKKSHGVRRSCGAKITSWVESSSKGHFRSTIRDRKASRGNLKRSFGVIERSLTRKKPCSVYCIAT